MIDYQEITDLLKTKYNGLDIYLNILTNVQKHQIYDCKIIIDTYRELKNCLEKFEKYLNDNKLNENFTIYFKLLLNNIYLAYNENSKHFDNLSFEHANQYFRVIMSSNDNISSSLIHIQFVLETLEKLNFYNNNMVFIGSNGSGKSSFANDLKKHFNNYCVAISAQRILNIPTYQSIDNIVYIQEQVKQRQIKDISNKESNYVHTIMDEFSLLLRNLFSENFVVSHQFRIKTLNKEVPEKEISLLDITIDIWNDLIPHRIIQSTDGMNLSVITHEGNQYEANKMSDGEKVVLFCVGQVLLAPKHSFIIVDEPELFLNKNIVNKLWNKLEILRNDCCFIYLTHELDFAINRDALKFWIKSYNNNRFEFEKIENNEIPQQLVMELLGSQKPILFCEGKNDGTSYDLKILSILFPQFNIKAVESCFNVINYTKAFNNMKYVSVKAFGLIDSDFHPDTRLINLENDGIYNFRFSEIENLCLDQELFTEFALSLSAQTSAFEKIQENIFSALEREKIMQSSQYVNFKIDYYYKDSHINKSKNLTELQNNFINFNQPIQIEEWFNQRVGEINHILERKDYTKAIQIFNNKGLIKIANEALEISNYIPRLIIYLNRNKGSVKHLVKYFHKDLVNYTVPKT